MCCWKAGLLGSKSLDRNISRGKTKTGKQRKTDHEENEELATSNTIGKHLRFRPGHGRKPIRLKGRLTPRGIIPWIYTIKSGERLTSLWAEWLRLQGHSPLSQGFKWSWGGVCGRSQGYGLRATHFDLSAWQNPQVANCRWNCLCFIDSTHSCRVFMDTEVVLVLHKLYRHLGQWLLQCKLVSFMTERSNCYQSALHNSRACSWAWEHCKLTPKGADFLKDGLALQRRSRSFAVVATLIRFTVYVSL